MLTGYPYTCTVLPMATNENENQTETYCCEAAEDEGTNDLSGTAHDGDCDNYDGAPYYQWEVTTPDEVYMTDEAYSLR